MITKNGNVLVEEDMITISHFTFEEGNNKNYTFDNGKIEAIGWAIKRLEEELIKIQ